MNKIALTVAFLILFSGISHAISKNDATKVINKLKADNTSLSSPLVSEENVAQAFKTPPGKDYDASKDRCIEARDFKITNLAMKLQYEFVKKKWFWELDQWDCQFHVVKIDYELTCLNNLTYNGTHYIASESSLIELNREGWTRGRRMAREAYGFKENLPISEYINANGTITRDAELGEWRHYTIAKIDTASIFKKWENQKVSVPDYEYAGAPGILPRPVLLIHGLGKTYEDWGVEAYSEGSPEFKAGKVKKYKNGSLPDMLARSNNLNTDTDAINSNGIYFLQIDYDIESVESIFSNVIAFYEKIEFVMNDYYRDKLGIDWRKSDIYKIDLVTHSLGGLVVRAMLGVMQARIPFLKTGLENPLNHINRLVTVNTPHFGSQLAADASRMPPGLELIVKDIENPTDHTLVSAKVNLFLEKLGLAVYSIMLGYENVAHLILGSEFHLRLKGPYIGVYKPELFVKLYDLIEGAPTKLDSITTLKDFANMMKVTREFGIFLDKDSRFIDSLSNFSQDIKTGIFPLRPDGTPITLLPMYSDSAHKALPELFRLAGEEADYLCSRGEKDPNCFAVGAFLKSYVKENFNVRLTGEKFDKNFYNALLDIQNDWLKHSDGLVEVNSQKFYNPDRNDNLIDNPNLKGYFLPPRPYAIHNAISPYEAVLHGPVTPFRNEGATRQGLDLLCALSSACDAAFEKAVAEGRGAVLLLSETLVKGEFSERVLDVTGDFNLAPSYISEGIQGLSISSNGETILTAEYEPEKGSTITLKSSAPMQPASQGVMPLVMAMSPMSASAEQFELVVGPEIATQPSISRKGDSVIVSFVNYSGRAFKKEFLLP
ncbi:MAG: putative lipase [Fibromonadaceae bacterium]|nr:putative lipase [Fibromonadaceae bacterium]